MFYTSQQSHGKTDMPNSQGFDTVQAANKERDILEITAELQDPIC